MKKGIINVNSDNVFQIRKGEIIIIGEIKKNRTPEIDKVIEALA